MVASCEWIAYIVDFASADGTVIVNAAICVYAASSNTWIYAFLALATLVAWTF